MFCFSLRQTPDEKKEKNHEGHVSSRFVFSAWSLEHESPLAVALRQNCADSVRLLVEGGVSLQGESLRGAFIFSRWLFRWLGGPNYGSSTLHLTNVESLPAGICASPPLPTQTAAVAVYLRAAASCQTSPYL